MKGVEVWREHRCERVGMWEEYRCGRRFVVNPQVSVLVVSQGIRASSVFDISKQLSFELLSQVMFGR